MGVRMISTPSLAKMVSKSRVNLLSRSPLRKRSGVDRLLSVQVIWRVCWAVQALVGLAVQPAVDAPAGEFDEEEHVQPLQRDSLDDEEVDREHARGLRPQKGTPGESAALGGRAKPRLPQDLPHRDAEAVQLPGDPLIAPAPGSQAPAAAPAHGSRRRPAAARCDRHRSSAWR
jgi:hypothetical protein